MIRKIYKFGGASVKDANAVRNLKDILEKENRDEIMLVISAMGKTTNAIEKALSEFRKNNGHLEISALSEIIDYHENIMTELFNGNTSHPIFETMTNLFLDLYLNLQETGYDYDYQYDNTVSFGEMLSTTLISAYLNECGIKNELIDAREYIITDHNFRSANPEWDECRSCWHFGQSETIDSGQSPEYKFPLQSHPLLLQGESPDKNRQHPALKATTIAGWRNRGQKRLLHSWQDNRQSPQRAAQPPATADTSGQRRAVK